MKTVLKIFSLILLFSLVASCAKKEDESVNDEIIDLTPVEEAPQSFSYTESNNIFILGVEKSISPQVVGSNIVFSVEPRLPAGLSLNLQTGVISGTAIELKSSATYTVIASNFGGSLVQELNISVLDQRPSEFFYTQPSIVAYKGERIGVLTPNLAGGRVTNFVADPPLPSGFDINPQDGTITGFSDNIQSPTQYKITASNSGGFAETMIQLTILPRPPINFNYSFNGDLIQNGEDGEVYPNGLNLNLGEELVLNPLLGGDTADTFMVSPDLPEGLNLDSDTGIISGRPLELINTTEFTFTASNVSGQAIKKINLTTVGSISTPVVGENFTCLLKNLEVFCSGLNDKNQLLTNSLANDCNNKPCSKNFIKLNYNNDSIKVKKITAGANHICALDFNDEVICWGDNNFGQSGHPSLTETDPYKIRKIDNSILGNVTSLSSGLNHTCALTSSQEVFCWGDNSNAQLNNSSAGTQSSSAVQLMNPGKTGNQTNVSKISLGSNYTTYVSNEQAYVSTGNSAPAAFWGNGKSADGSGTVFVLKQATETQVGTLIDVLDIFSNDQYSFARLSDNSLYSWGNNSINRNLFNQKTMDLEVANAVDTLADLEEISLLSLLPNSTCLYNSVSTNILYCQGSNAEGELGNSSANLIQSSPISVRTSEGSNLSDLKSISSGWGNHRCAVQNNNKVYCWGSNENGQLGTGDLLNQAVAKEISNL